MKEINCNVTFAPKFSLIAQKKGTILCWLSTGLVRTKTIVHFSVHSPPLQVCRPKETRKRAVYKRWPLQAEVNL